MKVATRLKIEKGDEIKKISAEITITILTKVDRNDLWVISFLKVSIDPELQPTLLRNHGLVLLAPLDPDFGGTLSDFYRMRVIRYKSANQDCSHSRNYFNIGPYWKFIIKSHLELLA